ncbi:MAG: WHG domain-containing protein [Rhizobiaceae bacterium]|nr:WHG domain-containing protein [Rhizobiaceae bacterium]
MVGKREAKREELKSNLMKAATGIIEEQGVRALNARNVTGIVGCALGSLYTAFEDLDDLIVHVNSQTLSDLGDALRQDVEGLEDPVAILKGLARGYVTFAQDNFRLWNALFEYADMTSDVPDWHEKEQAFLITFIQGPVRSLSPHLSEEEAMLRARTLFAAVHGIVAFSLQKRYIGLSRDELEPELIRFIDQMLAGLEGSD